MKARHNPFAVDRVQSIRYRPLEATFEDLLARLDAMCYRAAIVGPEGAGKTTLLEDLQDALAKRGRRTTMIFVNDTAPLDHRTRQRLMSQLSQDEIILLDGADAISYVWWLPLKRHVLRHAAGLVVTTHRPGRLPTLIDCTTTPQLLGEIVARLLPDEHDIDMAMLERLYHHYQGNIRNCLRELYDLCACDQVV